MTGARQPLGLVFPLVQGLSLLPCEALEHRAGPTRLLLDSPFLRPPMSTPQPPFSCHLLLQCEAQVVAGRLDLVLGLQVGHGICVDTVNGYHEVTLAELGLGRLAPRRDLRRWQMRGCTLGR